MAKYANLRFYANFFLRSDIIKFIRARLLSSYANQSQNIDGKPKLLLKTLHPHVFNQEEKKFQV